MSDQDEDNAFLQAVTILVKGGALKEVFDLAGNPRRSRTSGVRTIRLPNGPRIGPGCVRSPGTDVSPKQSGAVRVSVSLAAAAICRPVAFEATGGYGAAFAVACVFLLCASVVALKIDTGARLSS